MFYALFALGVLLAVVATWALRFSFTENNLPTLFVGLFVGIGALVCLLVSVITPIDQSVQRSNCRNFSTNTNYPTQFRVWNAGFSYDCFAETHKNGVWLPTSQLRDVNG